MCARSKSLRLLTSYGVSEALSFIQARICVRRLDQSGTKNARSQALSTFSGSDVAMSAVNVAAKRPEACQ
jgi:hypothetical protein